MSKCSCPHLMLGSEMLEAKNWNPACPCHGVGSEWFNSPEEVKRREEQRDRLIELQRRAREAREKRDG